MESSSIHRHQNIRKLKGLLYIENRTLRFKAFYLVFFFGCGTLRNYLPVYFRQIGFNAVLTGVITGVRPFTGFISAPVFSFLADKTGYYKVVLLTSLVISALSYFSLSFVSIVQQAKGLQPMEYIKANITTLEKNSVVLFEFARENQNHSKLGKIPGSNFERKYSVNYRKLYVRKSPEINRGYQNNSGNSGNASRSEYHLMVPDTMEFKYSNQSIASLNKPAVLSETVVFFTTFGLVILGDFFNAPVGAIMSSTIIYWEGSSQFGKQRVFGAIGFGVGSFLTGIAIDKTMGYNYFSSRPFKAGSNSNPNFLTAFFLYLGTNFLLLVFVSCGLDVARERKSKIHMVHIKRILSRGLVLCFLFYVFVMGVVGGTIMLFLFWFLENLGASQSLLGLCSAVMTISEVPIFPFCAKMIKVIGHVGVLGISLTCSIIRLICYTFLKDPWYVLLIEPLHGITLAAMWSTSIAFASTISSPEAYTTVEGVTSGCHYGLGWGLGAVLGGAFYKLYGPRNLFRGCIVLCCVGYIFLGLLYILKRRDHTAIYDRKRSINVGAEYEEISGEIL